VKRDQMIDRVLGGISYPHIIYEIRKAYTILISGK
jgi:hypothetical protein